MPRRVPLAASVFACAAACGAAGCGGLSASLSRAVAVRPVDGPAPARVLRAPNAEAAWETVVSTLHRFGFRTRVENKLDGTIETRYVVGSGLSEGFRKDSVGLPNRLEDTFQSTRRKVVATVKPVGGGLAGPAGGYEVTVRALKEIEDVRGVVANTTGGATFQTENPLERELRAVDGQFGPSRWVPLGRDPALEDAILADLGR